jgi:hypothetical protein
MTKEQRQQLERRLDELDAAVAALRRGFARIGQQPPAICDVMISERSEVARLLNLDAAIKQTASDLSWSDWKAP